LYKKLGKVFLKLQLVRTPDRRDIMGLEPIIPKTRVYMEIVDQIKDNIKKGYFRPGSLLPSERELAGTFQVSRSSVREAITLLGSLGIIEVKRGKGAYVRDFRNQKSWEHYFDTFSLLFDIEPEQTLQLLQVRMIIEPQTAALAAKNASKDDLYNLQRVLNDMEEVSARDEIGEEYDFQFHFIIASATGNQVLVKTLSALSDLMRKSLQQTGWFSLDDHNRVLATIKEHGLILKALKNQDSKKAQEYMFEHLEGVKSNFKKYVKEDT